MAIVHEKKYPHGTVRIVDDAYRDCTREEMAARRREAQLIAGQILARLIREGKV